MSQVDVLVIGGGPSGLMAAIGAVERGDQVILVDEWSELGGRLRYEPDPVQLNGKAVAPADLRQRLVEEAEKRRVHLQPDTTVWGVFRDARGLEVGLVCEGRQDIFRPKRILLATGATDRAVIFPGATLPGVMTLRAIRILLHTHGVRPGRRFVIVGEGGDSIQQELEAAGGEVVLCVPLTDAVRLHVTGERGVERASLGGRDVAADIVVVAAGTRPDAQLAWSLECEPEPGLPLAERRPARTEIGQTSIEGVFVCGSVAGGATIEEAMRDGYRVGAQLEADGFDIIPMASLGEAGA